MVDYQQCFIENMKLYRKRKNVSQAQLAEACDVSNGTIGNIECGKTKPSFDLILSIADRLGVKPEALFFTPEQADFSAEIQEERFTKSQLKAIRKAFVLAASDALDALAK